MRLRFEISGNIGGGIIDVAADGCTTVDDAGLRALRALVVYSTISLHELSVQRDLPRVLLKYAARSSLPRPVIEGADLFDSRYDRHAIARWCANRGF